ncbi:MAG: ferredoxin [Candidatus Ornithomonoglobus sp.]
MKYYVNDNCIGCGFCEGVCPEVFHITDEGVSRASHSDVPQGLESSADEALEGCPVNAIVKA